MRWHFIRQETVTAFCILYGISFAGTITGLITPTLEMLTLIMVLSIGIWWIWKAPHFIPTFGLPMLGYGAALVLSTAFSSDWRRSLMQVGYWSALTIAYWVMAFISRSEEGRARLERAYWLTMIFIVGFGLFQLRLINFDESIPRIGSILGNYNLFAVSVMIAILMSLHHLIQSNNRRLQILLIVWLFILAIPLTFTASRAVWVATAVSVFVFALLHLRVYHHKNPTFLNNPKTRLWLIGSGISVALFIVIFVFFARNLVSGASHGRLSTREAIWQSGWDAFTEQPIFGIGAFTFGTVLLENVSTPPESAHAHPHNIFLYIAVETGIVGLIVLGWFIWTAVQKLNLSHPNTITTVAFLVGLFCASLLDTPFIPAMILLYFLVWLILNPESPQATRGTETKVFNRIFGFALLLLCLGIHLMQLPGELAAERGVNASVQGDWLAAASYFERASELDPQITAYEFQAAYAYGRAGIGGDRLSLLKAIQLYQHTLEKDPHYAVHWANLAILEAYADRHDLAQLHAMQAAKLAPAYRPIGFLPRRLSDPTFAFEVLPTDAAITGEYSWYFYHVPGVEPLLYRLP